MKIITEMIIQTRMMKTNWGKLLISIHSKFIINFFSIDTSDDDGGLAAGMSRMNFEDAVSSEDDEDDFVYTRNYGDEKESAAYIAYKKRITREFERYDDDRGSDSEGEEEED